MELRIALRGLSRRFPDLALAVEPSELAFHDLSIVHGIGELPVTFGPAGSAVAGLATTARG